MVFITATAWICLTKSSGQCALLQSLLLRTVTILRLSNQRSCDIPIRACYRYYPFRLNSSTGVSPDLWFKIKNRPVCDATGDQNHRSVSLWEQPAVRWCVPNLETVTVHRRSDSKRTYRPQAFFLKLSLTAMIKWIKNKSRSYKKLMIYRLDTLLTLDFLVAIPL